MNILVIGNGFDLAHDLPTNYTDFLKWLEKEYEILNYMEENNLKHSFPKHILDKSKGMHNMQNNVRCNLFKMIKNNTWIEYFMNVKSN